MKQEDAQKRRIETRVEELKAHLAEIELNLDQPLDPDLEDQAIDLEDDEVLESMGRANQRELQLLEAALERMAKGDYGICRRCENEISEMRLRAVPYAVLCRYCAGKS